MAEATQVWEGPEVLRPYLWEIDKLVPSEENARKGDIMALVGSLKRFTQVRAIVITPEGQVVAGHHLRLAAIELGWTHIAAIPNEFADDDERKAYLVADNALANLGGYDEQMQLTLLGDLEERGKLEGTGVTSDDVEDMRARMDAIPETQAPETWGGGYAEDADAALARAEALATSKQKKEVLMMLDLEEYEKFGENIRILQDNIKTTGVKDTVVAAVEMAAHSVTADVPSEPMVGMMDPEPAAAIPAPTLEGEIPEVHVEQTSLLDDDQIPE